MENEEPSNFSLIISCLGFLILFFSPLVLFYLFTLLPTKWIVLSVGLLIVLIALVVHANAPSEAEKAEKHRRILENGLGVEYIGEQKDSKRVGHGTLIISRKNQQYIGSFKDNLFHGQGTMTWADGKKYEGFWLNGEIYGQGSMTWPDGRKYEGEFRPTHKSVVFKQTHQEYFQRRKQEHPDWAMAWFGFEVDGLPNGRGTMWWPDGTTHEGEWRDNTTYGQGTMTWPDGRKYEGEWRRDGDGNGTITWSSGAKFVGAWGKNKNPLSGTYTWPDGSTFVGTFVNNRRYFHGTMTWADGKKYEGEWRDDERHGQGTMTWADGTKYSGGFRDDKFHGFGTVTRPDGSEFSGVYTNGNYAPYTPPKTSDYVVSNENTNRTALSEEAAQALIEKFNKASDMIDEIKMQNAGGGSNGSRSMGVAAKVATGAVIGWGLGNIIFKQDSSK